MKILMIIGLAGSLVALGGCSTNPCGTLQPPTREMIAAATLDGVEVEREVETTWTTAECVVEGDRWVEEE